ncbi:hypothetical protein [Nonomuraea jabiensis]|uniref:DUF4158 domain-containing protein n=1 Tax=Nonomuraea jabiensis TaxID=882448 RepID=A0A7W9GDS1_9ACTN|nr:hypothetical protein [Nonomuraea jabiensis]MBB5781953.1 hypothetical protein [Nonomuraea jabiensis]
MDAALFAAYDWSGRTIEYHRAQIRKFHDFREPTIGDEDKLADWLATKICPVEMSRDRLRGALLARCWRAAAKTGSSRRRRLGSNACWARPRRCSSGTSPPRPCSACRSSRLASWKS